MKEMELWGLIGSVLDDCEIPYEISEIGGKITLVIPCGSGEASPEDCTLSMSDWGEDGTVLQFLVMIDSGLDEKTTKELIKLMPAMNLLLRLGSFGVMKEGALYFSTAMLVDGIGAEALIRSIMAMLDVVTAAAARGKEELLPVLKGEADAEQLLQEEIGFVI